MKSRISSTKIILSLFAFGSISVAQAATLIGSGTCAQGALADGAGGRTSVDLASKYLPAGTYNVDEFNFWGVNTNGTVQPFLSTGTATPQYTPVWAGTADGAVTGTNTVSYTPGAQQFTLTAPTRIYSGFAMSNNAVGYASGGSTGHNGTALTPVVHLNVT